MAPSARNDDTGMKVAVQSLRQPRGQISVGRFICPQITHVDSDSSKKQPTNYSKTGLTFGTWNVLSQTSSSSQLFQLSENISEYKLDLLGITETHMPGTGSELLTYLFREDGRYKKARCRSYPLKED